MSKGYLIPENAQTAETRCLRVFVPDDPLYIAAFLGAYEYFGQWTAWERDTAHRGAIAASVWKDAIDVTIDSLSIPCSDNPITDDEMGDILDKLNDVISRLTEIEDMNITVTQTNGCCCDGDTTSTSTTTTSRTIDPEDTGIIPPYDTDHVNISDPMKCRTTNYLARMVTETVRALAGRLGGGALLVLGIVEVLFFVLSWVDMVPGDEVVGTVIGMLGLITIAQAIARMAGTTMFTWGVLDELAEFLESPQVAEEFVCYLSGWTNSEELGALLTSFINSKIAELDTVQPVRDAMIAVFGLLFDSPLINWFTQNSERIVPADFIPEYDCICGATGDSCPTSNIVLSGLGTFPGNDLEGTTQGFASTFNSTTGYYEIIFELAANYCVSIDNATYTPEEAHETCNNGVMVPSDGSCIRRFVARSQAPFATAVEFVSQSADCACTIPAEATACIDYGNGAGEVAPVHSEPLNTSIFDDAVYIKPNGTIGDPSGRIVDVSIGNILLRALRIRWRSSDEEGIGGSNHQNIVRITLYNRDAGDADLVIDIDPTTMPWSAWEGDFAWSTIPLQTDYFPIRRNPSTGNADITIQPIVSSNEHWRLWVAEICIDYDLG